MKKFLRFIGVLLLVIIIGVVVLGLVAPKDFSVERTVAINAPREVVASQMLQYKNFHNWSPWQELDPAMKTEITGPELTAGTRYSWQGNDDVGSGEMVIKEAKPNEVQYAMHFKEPFESKADGYWRVEDAGNGQSKAVWGFTSHASFPWNGLMMVMGMTKVLSKDFDKGLNKLKAYSEQHANNAPAGWNIESVQFPGNNYAAIRKTVDMDVASMTKFFDESYAALGKAAGSRISGYASNLVYQWDETNGKADMAAAFPVSGEDEVKGATMIKVAPTSAYKIVYTGGYHGSGQAHGALTKHVQEQKKEISMVVEEYVKGPGEERDSTKWVTNILYLTK